ncbi:uncharacterized protein LOC120928232 [Rana temporaria]|uniref:uncharacterized protein LOC120928230 n=1 Tax=Rana temporaria TaxID=8407 RepID=UPI001AAC8E4E|nr:uncharacterized protein LOC120928230 [Rana temporaria]XP_040195273.1 uncharacterized protein LOC120928232 [Rana temporaria]
MLSAHQEENLAYGDPNERYRYVVYEPSGKEYKIEIFLPEPIVEDTKADEKDLPAESNLTPEEHKLAPEEHKADVLFAPEESELAPEEHIADALYVPEESELAPEEHKADVLYAPEESEFTGGWRQTAVEEDLATESNLSAEDTKADDTSVPAESKHTGEDTKADEMVVPAESRLTGEDTKADEMDVPAESKLAGEETKADVTSKPPDTQDTGLDLLGRDYQYIPALGKDNEYLAILPGGQRMLDEPEGQDSSEDVRAWYHTKVQVPIWLLAIMTVILSGFIFMLVVICICKAKNQWKQKSRLNETDQLTSVVVK